MSRRRGDLLLHFKINNNQRFFERDKIIMKLTEVELKFENKYLI